MKKNQKQSHKVSRRDFLRGSAAAGVGAAIVAGMPGAAMAADDQHVEQIEKTSDKGYQLTSHVKQYYKTLEG